VQHSRTNPAEDRFGSKPPVKLRTSRIFDPQSRHSGAILAAPSEPMRFYENGPSMIKGSALTTLIVITQTEYKPSGASKAFVAW